METALILGFARLGFEALKLAFDDKGDKKVVIAEQIFDQIVESYPECKRLIEMAKKGELSAEMLGDDTFEELKARIDAELDN